MNLLGAVALLVPGLDLPKGPLEVALAVLNIANRFVTEDPVHLFEAKQ